MPFKRSGLNMDWGAFWGSVAALRRIEYATLLITMGLPLISVTVLLTIRHRIKALQHQSTQNQGVFFDDKVGRLENTNRTLSEELGESRKELGRLRHITAPRQLSAYQEDVLLDKLRGVRAAPVIVAAYAFEEESAAYATQLATVIRKAGWEVTMNKASMNDFKGIGLGTVSLMHQSVPGLRELSQALSEAQLELHPREIRAESIAGALQDGSLLVVVGRK